MNKVFNPQDLVTDWYIPVEKLEEGYVYPGPIKFKESAVLMELARQLSDVFCKIQTNEFTINALGWTYRGQKIKSVKGTVIALRRVASEIPDLRNLGLDRAVQSLLLSSKLCSGGLVVIAGETGQGKSTTCGGMIKARLEKFGSFCYTIENPPELPLDGIHGNGVCIQTEVRGGDFAEALRTAVRCYPTQGNSILFIGEIRDPETAAEALRIAINGHLVVTSIHAADLLTGLKRMLSLAMSDKGMPETEAKSIFSSAFKLMLHQKLREASDGRKILEVKTLFSGSNSTQVANRIRRGELDLLSTEIQQQEILIKQGDIDTLLKTK